MIPEDIEKLIGGYATGTLSDDERRKLFEAALENQELFNVLHDEHALKELLDDPVSREMVRRAAAESLPRQRTSWFRRGWFWGAASAAVAAGLVFGLVESRLPPKASSYIAQTRMAETKREGARSLASTPMAQVEAVPSPPPTRKASRALVKKEVLEQPVLPPPFPKQSGLGGSAPATGSSAGQMAEVQTQQAQGNTGHNQMAGQQAQVAVTRFQDDKSQLAEVSEKAVPLAPQQSKLRSIAPQSIFYSFSRKMPNETYLSASLDAVFPAGETIRLTIFPRTAGPLTVMQWDAANPVPKRIFPLAASDIVQVRATENYTIPLDINVTAGEHLRVMVGAATVEIALPVPQN